VQTAPGFARLCWRWVLALLSQVLLRASRSTLHLLGGGTQWVSNQFLREVILQRPAMPRWSQGCPRQGCSLGTVTPGTGSVESFFSHRRFNPFSFLTAE